MPLQRLKEAVAALPLKELASTGFPRERHDPIGGKRGDQVAAAILSWLDETKFEYR